MNKKKLRVYFTDFWKGFNIRENFLTRLLSQRYELEIDPVDPELLIFTVGGFDFLQYKKAVRLFWTGENYRPDFTLCDYALSFEYDDYGGRNLRYPLYVVYGEHFNLQTPKIVNDIIAEKTKFCNMVVSQDKCKYRIEFYKTLNKMQAVDSGGKILNNVGGPVKDKMAFIKQYRFTLAMENSSRAGYTTEKIFEPMMANSIPIYWGNPNIGAEFNPKSFINILDFGTTKEAAEYIVSVDNDIAKYSAMLAQPWFINNEPNEYFNQERVLDFLEHTVIKTYPFTKEQIAARDKLAKKSAFKKRLYLFITRRSF